jgi:hypothetical protein
MQSADPGFEICSRCSLPVLDSWIIETRLFTWKISDVEPIKPKYFP